ncbi:Microtubule-associated protein 1A [Bienertia sinuspersici]
MAVFVRESLSRRVIRNIDLRNDKLKVYGTEIKEPMLRRLYESLTLGVGPKMGHIYVNCNGACYFFVTGKGICRPIYNSIFDWSAFEVIVPNSLTDSLRKKLEEKETEFEQSSAQCSSKGDCLEVANKNIEDLEHQLACCKKENKDMIIELRKLQDELSFAKDELISTKKEMLVSSENKVQDFIKDYQDNNVELMQKVSDKLQSVNSKVKFANKRLDQALVTQLWTNSKKDDLPEFIVIEDVDE